MAEYVTKIRTANGDKQIDYNALANKPAIPAMNGAVSTIASSNLTANRALVSNSNGKVAVSGVSSTELGYLDGVTAPIQEQIDGKAASSHNQDASTITSGTFASTDVKAKSGTDYSTARVRNIQAGTEDLTAGSSALANGDIYLVYE